MKLFAALTVICALASGCAAQCTLGGYTGCDTSVALGLTNQIIAQLGRMGYGFTSMPSTQVRCSAPCVNALQTAAANQLVAATRAKNEFITLNSAFRSSAQQYILYNAYLNRRCGITAAAKPGTSNHEGGSAIDTSFYDYWRPTLANYGWRWYGSGDVVHFDYTGGVPDIRAQNLKAFQMLWNQYRSDKITADGIYGPQTASALSRAPCGGF